MLFTNKALFRLIIPLVIEAFLGTTMGFVGTIMVASAGEAAVSAVALVESIHALIIMFISALATGGAIIIAQNIGKGTLNAARDAAKQLLYTTVLFSLFSMLLALIGNRALLSLVFGSIEPYVMDLSQIYFLITVISYPCIAIMSSISAVFRSQGISRTPMLVTLAMSIINIILCAVLIYSFNMGVLGAAIAALSSRFLASVLMILLIRNRQNKIYLSQILRIKLRFSIIKDILRVGLPSGLDHSMFSLGRLIMQSLIATFGTISIAANAVVGQVFTIIMIPGSAFSMALITVIGQCVGANDYKQAVSYVKRLVTYSYLATISMCIIGYLSSDSLLMLFNLSFDATELSKTVLIYTFIFTAAIHPLAFLLPNALRASGDVNFTMVTSILSMWIVRVCMSYVLEYTFRLGLLSVWFSMYSDWLVRAVLYTWRIAGNKWKTKRVV